MRFDDVNVLDILPQQPPFVMIDSLLYCDRKTTETALLVSAGNIFVENGCLSEPGLIENIAQTCAARMGYINKYLCRDTVKLGFIGAIRNMEITRLPQTGERLATRIDTVEEIFQMTLVNATVRAGGELIASCEMKISLTDIDSKNNGQEQ
ncbi:MAG: pseudouridylate synthase [Dysgonamonadaceae bacterium]|jgi:predicted hotdog family 3-hydroxylacyl-ACP dehydratase|nr:pseudouridylate synthase [Dysgonamonadaceae bacterium]